MENSIILSLAWSKGFFGGLSMFFQLNLVYLLVYIEQNIESGKSRFFLCLEIFSIIAQYLGKNSTHSIVKSK